MKNEDKKLTDMTREELIIELMGLREEVEALRARNSDMNWKLNPDRMGGQFTDEEINRPTRWC